MRDLLGKLFDGNKKPEEPGTNQESAVPIVPGATNNGELAGEDAKAIADVGVEAEEAPAPGQMEEPSGNLDQKQVAMTDNEITRPMRLSLEDTAVVPRAVNSMAESGKQPWLQSAMRCHVGHVRARNEDSALAFDAESGGQEPLLPFGLYIVADGMGGHYAGHEASKQVSRLVARHVLERIYVPLLYETGSTAGGPREPIREVMLDAIQEANKSIHSADPDKDSGTTLTAALIFGRRLYVAHVGDSRAYLMSDGELKPVTTDHSYVRRLQDAGQLTEDEAAFHPQRNMLYKAVGQGGELEIDTFTQVLPLKGKLILCSDGLWGLVPNSKLQEIVQAGESLQAAAEALIRQALDAGGGDNISVILVEFSY